MNGETECPWSWGRASPNFDSAWDIGWKSAEDVIHSTALERFLDDRPGPILIGECRTIEMDIEEVGEDEEPLLDIQNERVVHWADAIMTIIDGKRQYGDYWFLSGESVYCPSENHHLYAGLGMADFQLWP